MNDIDKSWIKYVLLGGGIGFVIGEIIYHLLDKVIIPNEQSAAIELLKNAFPPVFTIIGLLVVLYYYNKNKYDGDGK